jgi:ribosomal protein S18 acetylase RimI-like enzyme
MDIDKNKITIRKASSDDIEMLIEFRITFLKEAQWVPTHESELKLRKSLKDYFIKALDNSTFISYIAEYENQSAGFSGMVLREQPGNFEIPGGKTGYILNMYTVKEFRNNGIGSMLFQKLIAEAKNLKLDKIELHATTDGEPIYRKSGFKEPHDKVLELILK